jgi:hypothetical protein
VASILVDESGTATPTATPSWTQTPVQSPTATPSNGLLQSVMAVPNLSQAGQPIRFELVLRGPASIRLSLYTVLGELVYETQVQGQTGLNIVNWELVNRASQEVASGLYLYTLQATGPSGSFMRMGKVVVLH